LNTIRPDLPAPEASRFEASQGAPSFDELFLENWTRIYRVLLRMVGDPSEAEDLALETFLRFYQHPPTRDDQLNLAGWLYRVATNLGLHSIRSFQRRARYEMAAGKNVLDETFESTPVEIQADEEDRRTARSVLAKMNPRQAQLLVLRYSGLSYKDIGQALGLSPTSIGPLLLRAEREFEKSYRALVQEDK